MNSKVTRYDAISQILHWLMVFLFLALVTIGYGRDFMPALWRDNAINLHKALGLTFLGLGSIRLIWALVRKGIQRHSESKIEVLLAKIVHIMLYGLMFALPLTGWIMVSAFGRQISFFGLFDIPSLLQKDRAIAITFKNWHETLAFLISMIVGAHVSAAFFHHFIRRDDVLKRMIP